MLQLSLSALRLSNPVRPACRRTCLARTLRFSTSRAASTTPETRLGVRSELPPDGAQEPNSPGNPKGDSELSDQEWEIRTGRAIYVIQQSLPHFFDTGLMVAVDKNTGEPTHSTYGALSLPFKSQPSGDREYIYSPKVRLSYTPPVQLPTPFPDTLHVEGIPLYMASSVFVRHTLNALYSDLRVSLTKFIVETPKQNRSALPPEALHEPAEKEKPAHEREKSLSVRMEVLGKARVSGAESLWDVQCTYNFSAKTGMVASHTVNSIHPTPSQAVYDSLRSNLARLVGMDGMPGTPSGGRAFQKAPVQTTKRVEDRRSH